MNSKYLRSACVLVALLGAAPSSHAWPTTSPSAKAAARLKYHPPANWLQHYLPDDRYKIAGGVWKVVSTQYDTYYHRPESQYMLRQPAGIVIGFASAKEAEEAGYRPAGAYFADPSGGGGGGRYLVKIGRGRGAVAVSGTRINLSDGSTALLPDGWTFRPNKIKIGGTEHVWDTLSGPGSQASVMYSQGDAPRGMSAAQLADPKFYRQMLGGSNNFRNTLARGGLVTNVFDGAEFQSLFKNLKIAPARLAGMRGVSINFNMPGIGPSITVARGNRLYSFSTMGKSANSPAARAIIQSFRPK